MTIEIGDFGCNNICDGCPAAIALGIRKLELRESPDNFTSKTKRGMQEAEVAIADTALNTAAGQIACRDIEKNLPAMPDIMPAVGSQELIKYVSACPSFLGYTQLRTS